MRAMTSLVAVMLLMPGLLLPETGHAEPKPLGDADLGEVTGGFFDVYIVMPVVVVHNNNNAVATGVNSKDISANAVANVSVNPVINLQPTDMIGTMAPVVLNAPLAGAIAGPTVLAPSTTDSAVAADAIGAAPMWVPWAAELRSSLGVR